MIDFNKALKEYFVTAYLSISDRKKYYLIQRYQDKVSNRLKAEADILLKQGEDNFRQSMTDAINEPNYFLKTIKQEPAWTGALIKVPLE